MNYNTRRRPYRVAKKELDENPRSCAISAERKHRFKAICMIVLGITFLQGFILGMLISKK